MPVHAQVETVLGLIEKSGNPEFHELSPQEARAQFEAKAPILDAKPIEVHRVEDHKVNGPGGPIPVRVSRPAKVKHRCRLSCGRTVEVMLSGRLRHTMPSVVISPWARRP